MQIYQVSLISPDDPGSPSGSFMPAVAGIRSKQACLVQRFQLGAAGVVGFCHLPLQNLQPFPIVVQFHEQPFQLVLVLGKPDCSSL